MGGHGAQGAGIADIDAHCLLHADRLLFQRLRGLDTQADAFGALFGLNRDYQRLPRLQEIAVLVQPF